MAIFPTTFCCDNLRNAFDVHTDNEGWGPLAKVEANLIHIGDELPPIRYCPWCGTSQHRAVVEPRGKHSAS
jgi:hypothetical protein